jgi:hypothetical protein
LVKIKIIPETEMDGKLFGSFLAMKFTRNELILNRIYLMNRLTDDTAIGMIAFVSVAFSPEITKKEKLE